MPARDDHRLLLVEFVPVGRMNRAVVFPELAGVAQHLGVPWRWLRFGIEADARARTGDSGLTLSDQDFATLARVLQDDHPSCIAFSHRPADVLVDRVSPWVPTENLFVLGEPFAGTGHRGRLVSVASDRSAWSLLLRCPPTHLVDLGFVPPHFGFEPANDLAARVPFLPQLTLGRPCRYERSVSSNPRFSGVDLRGCLRTTGCSFCNRPPQHGRGLSLSQDEFEACVRALRDTLPLLRERLRVRLGGEGALRRLESLVDAILACAMAPADWLLDGRVDDLLRSRDDLAKAAQRFENTGHRILVMLVGVESFVRADLERMNKGVTPLDHLDAALALFDLERRHPDTFSFRESGGFSTIFLTPWTTLEDFAFNLRVVQVCRLEGLCAKVLGDRLRLEPGLPITALAARDGLLVDAYDDPMLDTAAHSFYGDELPWKFADDRMQELGSVLVRMAAARDARPADDDLGRRVEQWVARGRSSGLSVVDLALRRIDGGSVIKEGAGSGPSQTVDGAGEHERGLVALTRAGLKRVAKIEAIPEHRVEALLAALDPPNPTMRRLSTRGPTSEAEHAAYDLFFGKDPADVRDALAWTTTSETSWQEEVRNEAMRQVGVLLGYPPCCASRFAQHETPASRLSYAWLHLARRMEVPEAVSPSLNPFAAPPLGDHVPCSLRCEASLAWWDEAWAVLARDEAWTDRVAELRGRARHPWLVGLQGQGAALELVPEEEPGERFRFRAGVMVGSSSVLDLAARGHEIVIEHERLSVRGAGEWLADLSLRAFVWWHERALQADLWTRVLALRAHAGAGHFDGGRVALDIDGALRVSPRLMAIQQWLEEGFQTLRAKGSLRHVRLLRCEPVALHRLLLVVQAGKERVELFVTHAEESEHPLFCVGTMAFTAPAGEAIDTPLRRAVFRAMETELGAWVRRNRVPG
jgi:hypothetical protein